MLKSMGETNFCTPTPPKALNQFRCHVKYITTSRQRVDVQNLVGIDSAVTDLRMREKSTFCVDFYSAMLCIRGTSHGPVSVCVCVCLCLSLSVISRCSTKTAKRRISQTTPHDSPETLVFWCQRSLRNSTGVTPYEGAKRRWGGSKSATFDK